MSIVPAQGMAAQVSAHTAEETLTRDQPRLLADFAEALAPLLALVHLRGQRVGGGDAGPGSPYTRGGRAG